MGSLVLRVSATAGVFPVTGVTGSLGTTTRGRGLACPAPVCLAAPSHFACLFTKSGALQMVGLPG